MKFYHIFFFLFKIIVGIHLTLVFFKVIPGDDISFLINESLFKLCIGSFLGFYFLFSKETGLNYEYRILISIAGFVILYDINYRKLYTRLREFVSSFKSE